MKRPQVMTPAQSKSEATAEILANAGARILRFQIFTVLNGQR